MGKEPLGVEIHVTGHQKDIEKHQRLGEKQAKDLGLNLRIIKSTGKTAVSMSGISQKRWEKIFGKKKKK